MLLVFFTTSFWSLNCPFAFARCVFYLHKWGKHLFRWRTEFFHEVKNPPQPILLCSDGCLSSKIKPVVRFFFKSLLKPSTVSPWYPKSRDLNRRFSCHINRRSFVKHTFIYATARCLSYACCKLACLFFEVWTCTLPRAVYAPLGWYVNHRLTL